MCPMMMGLCPYWFGVSLEGSLASNNILQLLKVLFSWWHLLPSLAKPSIAEKVLTVNDERS